MGNEASQEGGGEEGPGAPQQPPRLVSQQSAPLPPPPLEGGAAARRGSCAGRRTSVGIPSPHEEPDLTNLTEEERRVIRSVMARAQSMEEEPLLKEAEEEEEEKKRTEEEEPCCSLCRSSPRECACVECGAHTCRKCSRAIPSGKKHVWMCVPCSEKYPGLKPNARGPESENHSEIPPNSRRRTSDSGVLPPSERIADASSARGRSDSLPGGGQSPRLQKPQTRQEQSPRHPPNGSPQFRGPRLDQPPSQQGVRPQQRPRPEQQRQPSKEQRPQRFVNSKQPRTGEMQRPHHPTDQRQPQMEDMQNSQHPVDIRPIQPEDMTRPQHPTEPRQNLTEDIQRLQHAADPRYTQPGDMQRPQHPVDLKQSHTLSIQRPQHAMDPRQPQPGDLQRLHHPMDPKQPQAGDIQRQQHPMNPRQSQMGDSQRPQHNIDPRQLQPGDMQRPQHPMDLSQHQLGDLQRPPHPMDPKQPQPGDLQRPQHPMDLQQHQPGELQRLQNPIDSRQFQPGNIQRLQHPTDPMHQRLQHPLDPRKPHSSDLKWLQNQDDLQRASQANNNMNQLSKASPRDSRPQPPADLLSANNDPRRPDVENCHLPLEQHPNQYDPARTEAELGNQVTPVDQRVQQSQKHTQEPSQNQFIEANKRFGLENDLDYAKTKSYHLNEPSKPKPQHPIVNPPPFQKHEDILLCNPPDLPQQQRSAVEKQLPPPKRNQRLREPLDQQAVPRPQHPQEPFPCEQQSKEETVGCSTNPFLRNAANNPFRRESLPEVAAQQLPSQRRGSLDERLRPEDQTSKLKENSNKTSSDRRWDQPLERNCDKSSNLDEKQRSNVLNVGGVPVPRERTSLPSLDPYSEGRNGIPRTVPLTSLAQTLEQQPEDSKKERGFADDGVPQQQRKNEGWREEAEDEEDYFEMIERAIARPQPRDIVGKSAAEIQKQLMSRSGGRVESTLDHAVSLQEKRIDDPDDERGGGKAESLFLHEPPPVKHYLEEHKTQPVSYEAFSSAKALQNGRKDEPRKSNPSVYYYSQTAAASGGVTTTASDAKQPPNSDDWSPVSDLSPIADVSPSVEAAAEKELMEKFREKAADEGGVPRATSGTISGMLEEFNRALGLPPGGTSPVDDSEIKSAVSPLAVSPVQKEYQQQQERQSPQKALQQPTTPRRSHRRLPHPTVEQMQAAVAMAAQTPPPPSTTGAMLFGLDTKPCPELHQSFEQVYNTQKQAGAQTAAVPSPAPRNQNKNNNNQVKNSESSQPNQEGAALRLRSCGGGVPGRAAEEGGGDLSSPQTPGTPRDKVAGDSSDTQSEAESVKSVRLRRKLPNLPATDQCSTPSPTRKNMDRGKNNGFGDFNGTSCPIPKGVDNSKPLLAPSGGKTEASSGTPSPCGGGGSKLPEYMQSLKQQLRDELKAVTEERKAILEQRGNGPSSSSGDSRTEDSVSSAVSKSLATYQAQQSALLKQLQAQSPPHQSKPPSLASTPVSQDHSKTTYCGVPESASYRTHPPPPQQTAQLNQSEPSVQQSQLPHTNLQSQPQIAYHSHLLQYQNQPQVIQYQTQPHIPYKAQVSYYGSSQQVSAGQSVHESGRRTPKPMTPSRAGSNQDLTIYQTMYDLGRKTPQSMTPSRVGSNQDLSMYQTMCDLGQKTSQPMTPSMTGNSQDLSMYQTMCDLGRKTPQPMTPSRTGNSQDFSAFQTMYDSGRRTPQPMTPSRAGSNQDLTKYQTIYDSGRKTPQSMTPSRAGNSQDLSMYHQTMYDSGRIKSQPMTPSRITGSNQDLSAYQTIYDMGRRITQPMIPSRAGSSQDLTTYQVYDLGRRMSQPMTPSRAGSSQDLSMYQTVYDMGRRTPQTMIPSRAMSNQDLYRCIPDSGGGRLTPLPDAVPRYTGRPGDGDDITVMTTATTTVVSASEWSGGGRRQTATTVAPSAAVVSGGATVESLRRLQQPRMSPSPQKKGRRRHTSEIAMPPFVQIEQAAAHYTAQQRPLPLQYVQCYQVMTPTRPPPAFLRAVDFPSIESHARATDILLRSRGTLLDTRAQHEGGSSDAYFHTLNSEINRLRRSSENLYRETMYEKQWTPQDTPQTTERRKKKEKKCRKPRSWHPSPYVSEDEDEQLTREEKKAKIKAEIARRRLQIEENMRLHDQLCRLSSERQEEEEAAGRCRATPPAADDTSSVLKAIDEILRKDLYSGQKDYFQSGGYTPPSHRFGGGGWYESEVEVQQQQQRNGVVFHQDTGADPESAMDESIAAIASTFPTTPPPDILLSSSGTPPMPLLPDMPTRSRKLLENLGAQSRSGSAQSLYQDPPQRANESSEDRLSDSSSLIRSQRKQQRTPVSNHKYEFPVKRILLTRDPKDRSVSGNGLGMRVVGGKEVPGSNGTLIGAYVAKIFPGGVVETLGEVKEGDQVLEWNGVPLTGRTYEEVQRIIASSADEVEIVIRCDLNMLEAMGGGGRHPQQQQQQRRSSPGGGGRGGGGGQPPPEASGGGGGGSSPRGRQPAPFGKRSSGGGGGNVLMGNNHMIIYAPQNNMIRASSYWQDMGFGDGVGSVFAPGPFLSGDWPELYEHFSSDDLLEDEFENRWRHDSSVEQVQLRMCPRAAVAVYVPIARPSLKSALLDHRRCSLHGDDCAEEDLSPLLSSPLSRLSLYLSGLLREKAAKQKREPRERPRAPSDLPGLRPIFVNDWKKTKTKGGRSRGEEKEEEESDDPNNNNPRSGGGSERRGRSPEAAPPPTLFPKGCRGSFCVIL